MEYREERGWNDRRSDWDRDDREPREEARAYRPRTRRDDEQSADEYEAREERPRPPRERNEESGSYRPRTLRRDSDMAEGDGDAAPERESYESPERDVAPRRDDDREDRPRREERYGDRDRGYRDRRDGASRRMEERDERMARRFREGRQQQEQLTVFDPTQEMRLNRYIAHCGACSRRDADLMIERGEVTVNGEVVTTLGTRVIPAEAEVICRGKKLEPERKVYVLLNKPKDCFCTNDDEHAEGHTVLDLLGGAVSERIYPVGRLDRNSTGLLLLTNDGELTEQLTHPSHEKRKIYEVELDNPLRPEDMQRLLDGVEIEGEGTVKMDAVEYVRPESRAYVGVEIHTGQNRIVRRLFDALGYEVKKLDRVYYAGLTKKDLPRGEWRYLSDAEVIMLKTGRYE
ncbi:MAG: pseudouridine synthase [Bacteroides sp.]